MTVHAPSPVDAGIDDAAVRAAVAEANVPTLLMVLVHLTGDLAWLEPPYQPTRTKGMADHDDGGLPSEVQVTVRSAAAEAIVAWRRGRPMALPNPDPELLVRMLGVSMGEQVPSEYGEVLLEELSAGIGTSPPPSRVQVPTGFSAVIIGAGISGVAAAVKLQELGIPFVVLERAPAPGGVWRDNRYPGAGVDTPSHLYSYSFATKDWTQYFAMRDEIVEYVESVVDARGLDAHIRYGCEVELAEFDAEDCRWSVRVRDTTGSVEVLRPNVVLSCVGAFNPPVIPQVPGLDSFEGPLFHTADWPDDLDINDKSVIVVGSGASAMQVVPAIAESVAKLTIIQRSPQWVQPFEKLHKPVPDALRVLFQAVPVYRAWYRLRLSWIFHDKLYQALQREPGWSDERTINAVNEMHRAYFTDYIRSEIGDRPDLLEKVVPSYPPFGKRMLQDNGWFKTLTRDNVELVTAGVAEVRPDGVVTADGVHHAGDVVVFATGFDVVRFVSTFRVLGRDGRDLRQEWDDDDCRAYLGLTIHGFPNFFTVYGPNTQTGHGGSFIYTAEAQLNYIASLITAMVEQNLAAVEVRQDVYREYAETVDRMHEGMVWTHPAMTTYYRNSRGRVVAISPFRNVDFWRMTRAADLSEYIVVPQADSAAANTLGLSSTASHQ
ncbi:NAD(P)/FAD-dependent oxidoreductase [Sporichthya brevicatena]|uniref:NAD(P)/FAD-dependent oxidoreductase n=1 Tax=Sporichthya brevicatena TaxID=171442 RepID=A0ABN1H4Z4_9ACTN